MNSTATTCETILLRQFDADCRPDQPLPTDVANHLQHCESCRLQWTEQQAFDQHLKLALRVTPPTSLYRTAYQAAVELDTEPVTTGKRWLHGAYALLAGIAVGQALWLLPLTSSWPWLAPIGFLLVSCGLFLRDVYQETKALPTF